MDQTPSRAETVVAVETVASVIHCYSDDESDLLHQVGHS